MICEPESQHDSNLSPVLQSKLIALLEWWMTETENGRSPDRERFLSENRELGSHLADALQSLEFLERFQSRQSNKRGKPTRIGVYQIGFELGRGAMGVVYSATRDGDEDSVAIKVLPDLGTDALRVERFQREAKAASSLRHSHIVPVYELGQSDGYHFFTMKRIDGASLATFNRTTDVKNRDFVQTARGFGNIAQALHAAHEHGILHRDVKPSNILLDTSGQMWITDFGLAYISDCESLTHSGDLIGTIRYMSPEQASGKSESIDRRSDVFSLGVSLYETVVGTHPFEGYEGPQLLNAIKNKEPIGPRRKNPHVPVELDTIIRRAMRPNKSDRYASAGDFAQDLMQFANGKSIAARKINWLERLTSWSAKHPDWVLGGLLVALLCVVGLSIHSIAIWQEQSRTQAQLVRGNTNYYQARAAVDFLSAHVADQLVAIPGAETLRQDVLAETLNYYQAFIDASNADPRLAADVAETRLKIARLIRTAGNPSDAEAAFDQAIQSLQQAWEKSHDQNVLFAYIQSLNEAAVLQSTSGELKKADLNLQKVSECLEEIKDPRAKQIAASLQKNNAALIEFRRGNSSLALSNARGAVAMLDDVLSKHPVESTMNSRSMVSLLEDIADASSNLGVILNKSGDAQGAIDSAQRALSIRTELNKHHVSPEQQRRLALAFNNVAALEWKGGKIDSAIYSYQESVNLLEETIKRLPGLMGPRRELAVTLNNLGIALSTTSDKSRAESIFRRAITICSAIADADARDAEAAKYTGGIWNNLGVLLKESGKKSNSIDAFRNAVAYQTRVRERLPNNLKELSVLQQYQERLQEAATP